MMEEPRQRRKMNNQYIRRVKGKGKQLVDFIGNTHQRWASDAKQWEEKGIKVNYD